jgi:serine/threonine protein kinase/formylglycine-generating enzyme required for sulfatase activity
MKEGHRRLDHSLASERQRSPQPEVTQTSAGAKEPVAEAPLRAAKAAPEGLLEDDLPQEDPGPQGPQRMGRYRLDRLIGSGGMGVVYEAWDETLRRRVAIKVLPPGAQSQIALERFQQEALLTARLDHPNVVVVHEAGQVDGRAFIAMEYVDGESLETWIDRRLGTAAQLEGEAREAARLRAVGQLQHEELRTVCQQIRDVARALHHGHTYTPAESGAPTPIIHRDVKPGNIMIDRHAQPRLLDFGLAKELGVALTVTREALGTPLYMSPEQLFSAKRVGPRSDVYSLGMTLYACLTLARPFELSQPGRLFEQLMHEDPRDPQRLNPSLPDDLRTIVLKATAKDERERYPTAAALADDLDAYLGGRPIDAQPPSVARRLRRWARRRQKGLTALAVCLIALVTVFALEVSRKQRVFEMEAARQHEAASARSQARQRAKVNLTEARMIYELAAVSRAEDSEGDHWLALLNKGHTLEREAFEGLAQADAKPSAEVRRRALLARLARSDTKAEEELRKLHAESEKAAARRATASALAAQVAALDERGQEDLFHALCSLVPSWRSLVRSAPSTGALALAAGISETLTYGPTTAVLLDPTRDDWQVPIRVLQDQLNGLVTELQGLAEVEPAVAESLAELHTPAQVQVDVVGAPVDAEVVVARLERGAPGEALARGRVGQVLECEGWGTLLARVRAQGRESRVVFSLPRSTWGSSRPKARVTLAAPPQQAPAGMLLVEVPGTAPFWVDATEVRVVDYARFLREVNAGGHATCPRAIRGPDGCRDHTPRTSRSYPDDAPVTGIDYHDALAYAAWAGKQLPTAAQWEAAAFAGLPPSLEGANLPGYHDGYLWAAPAAAGLTSPSGAVGLVGNVAEWLLRTDEDLPFCEAAGGSWAVELPGPERGFRERFAPEARGEDLGFRCVVPVAVSAEAPAEPEPTRLSPIDEAPMDLVPGGEITLLPAPQRKLRRNASPSRGTFRVSPYYVDRHVVSNAAFARFCEATRRSLSPAAGRAVSESPDAAAEVTWEEAAAYAAWAGKRLPTEVELEAAARSRRLWQQGPDSRGFDQPQWCLDVWHKHFFRYANRHDPVNRWGSEAHVVRAGAGRKAGGDGTRVAFRCVSSVQTQEDR